MKITGVEHLLQLAYSCTNAPAPGVPSTAEKGSVAS